jgi:hypothetical protein
MVTLGLILLLAGLTCERGDIVPKNDYEKYQAALDWPLHVSGIHGHARAWSPE